MADPSTSLTHHPAAELVLPSPIQQYFETANAGKFKQMAALFAEDGQLIPPFEQPIVGKEAIAQYLISEATGMRFTPLDYEALDRHTSNHETFDLETSKTDTLELSQQLSQHSLVRGKAKTPLFVVNVAWEFVLNETQEIVSVKVKLLAKLNELLKLRS